MSQSISQGIPSIQHIVHTKSPSVQTKMDMFNLAESRIKESGMIEANTYAGRDISVKSTWKYLLSLLLTWFKFNSSMNK